MTVFDLSHPIRNEPPCTFTSVDKVPTVYFEEGDSHGEVFITSRIDNLFSNLCTHIDFPGHIPNRTGPSLKLVGEYPIERFVGSVAVLDVRHRMEPVLRFFREDGDLSVDLSSEREVRQLVESLETLAIGRDEVEASLAGVSDPRGIVLLSGLSKYWAYGVFDSWRYAYFYNAYFTSEACEYIVEMGLSFVGVDAFQLEHPIINFNGDEQLFASAPRLREDIRSQLRAIDSFRNHDVLLGSDVLIYENLNIPDALAGVVCDWFGAPMNLHLSDLNDNAICRPIALFND